MASENAALTQAMYAAIGTNDLAQVQNVIANGANYGKQTEQSETTADQAQQPDQNQQAEQAQQEASAEPAPQDAGVTAEPDYSEGYAEGGWDAAGAQGYYDAGYGNGDVVIMPDVDDPPM